MSNTGNRFLNGTEFTNITVVANCDNTDDGSIQASGTLFVNTIKEYDIISPGVILEDSIFASGKAIITSTEPSLNISTAALIVNGGVSVLKDSRYYGAFYLHNTENSTNLSSGSIIIDGGASVYKNVNIGGIVTLYNTSNSIDNSHGSLITLGGIAIQNTTDAISITSGGALTVSGGASIEKTIFANLANINNATIGSGNITNISSSNLYVQYGNIPSLTSSNIITTNISSNSIVTNDFKTTLSSIANLNVGYGTISNSLITNEYVTNSSITNLNTSFANINVLYATQGSIDVLTVGNLNVNNNFQFNNVVTNLSTSNVISASATITNLILTNSTFSNLLGTNIISNNLTTSTLNATDLTTANINATYISTSSLVTYNLRSINQTSTNSFITNATISNINASYGNIANITSSNISTTNLSSSNINVSNFTSGNIISINSYIDYITSGYLTITGTLPSFNSSSGTLISYGGVSIDIIENATSITSGGGLTVAGGASIAKDVYIGYTLYVPNISSSNISSIYGTMSHLVGNTLQYNNASVSNLNIYGTEPSINLSTGSLINRGGISINCTTDVTSLTSGGGLTVAGGASIFKSLSVGNTVSCTTLTSSSIYTVDSVISNINNTNITSSNALITNINSTNITSNNIYTSNISSTNNTFTNTITTNATTTTLHCTTLNYGTLSGTNIYTTSIDSTNIINTNLSSITSTITNLLLTNSTTLNQHVTNCTFSSLIGSYLDVNNASISSLHCINVTSSNLVASSIVTTTLQSLSNTFGTLYVTDTSASLNSTTASIILKGGLSIDNTTDSGSITSGGAVTINGGIAIKKNVYIGGNTWLLGTLDLNSQLITNVTAPSNSLDVVNKYYVDNRFNQYTIGNVNGNFTQGQVIVATTGGNITGFTDFIYDVGQGSLYIYSTNEATSVSQGGALQISGGASVDKSFYVGGNAHVLGTLDMNNQKITSVAIPTTFYDAANKYYVDNRFTEFTNNFTQGQLIIGSTSGTILGSSSLTFINNTLSVFTTLESNNLTSGSLTVSGGVGIQKRLNIGGDLSVKNVFMTPSPGDIFKEQSFSANNNQSVETDIVGFAFDSTIVRYFHAFVSVCIVTSSGEINSGYELKGIKNSSNGWLLNSNFIGDKAKITFSITSTGQIQYTSSNVANWVSTTVKFRALTTSV